MKADAEAGDPEAIKRYEAHLAKRREDYHKKKAEKEDIESSSSSLIKARNE